MQYIGYYGKLFPFKTMFKYLHDLCVKFSLIHINQNDPAGYLHQSIYKENVFLPSLSSLNMEERKERVLIFISAVFIELFININGVILTRDQEGQRLDTSGQILDIIGHKQCVRECMRRGDCLSVNYWRRDLRCQLNPSTVGLGAVLIPDVNCVYMERASQPQVMSAFRIEIN